jgi:hypothetical protein
MPRLWWFTWKVSLFQSDYRGNLFFLSLRCLLLNPIPAFRFTPMVKHGRICLAEFRFRAYFRVYSGKRAKVTKCIEVLSSGPVSLS